MDCLLPQGPPWGKSFIIWSHAWVSWRRPLCGLCFQQSQVCSSVWVPRNLRTTVSAPACAIPTWRNMAWGPSLRLDLSPLHKSGTLTGRLECTLVSLSPSLSRVLILQRWCWNTEPHLPLCQILGIKLGGRAWRQSLTPAEPTHWPCFLDAFKFCYLLSVYLQLLGLSISSYFLLWNIPFNLCWYFILVWWQWKHLTLYY